MKNFIKKFIKWLKRRKKRKRKISKEEGSPLLQEILSLARRSRIFYKWHILKLPNNEITNNKELFELLKRKNSRKYVFLYYSQDKPIYCRLKHDFKEVDKNVGLDNLIFFLESLGKKIEKFNFKEYRIIKEEEKYFNIGNFLIPSKYKLITLSERAKNYVINSSYFFEIGNDLVFRVRRECLKDDFDYYFYRGRFYFVYKHKNGEFYVLSFTNNMLFELDFTDFSSSYFHFDKFKIKQNEKFE